MEHSHGWYKPVTICSCYYSDIIIVASSMVSASMVDSLYKHCDVNSTTYVPPMHKNLLSQIVSS